MNNYKNFSKNQIYSILLISFIILIIIFSVLSFLVWNFRAEIFSYFAKEYLAEQKEKIKEENTNSFNLNKKDEEEILIEKIVEKEKEPVLNQEEQVVNVVKKTNQAVVAIILSKEVPKYEAYINPKEQNPFGDLFPGFIFNFPEYRQNGTEKKEIGGGSGFFVTSDGLIVTNRHVVSRDDVEYTVYTNDGKKYKALVVARDPVLDIALIKINGSNFTPLNLGNSDSLEVGHTVIAIGNALAQFKNTVSVGVISGLSRSLTAGDNFGKTELLDHVIQTDAAINPGNSGGPLLNLKGEVIGVNVAVAQGSQSIGFALPINSVKSTIESVKKTGKIIRPYLGVRYITIDANMKEKNNLPVDYGVLVKGGATVSELAVIPGSPANKAGIVENDIILSIDGVKLDEKNNLASIIRQKKIGDIIVLKILSKGIEKNISVTLEAVKDN